MPYRSPSALVHRAKVLNTEYTAATGALRDPDLNSKEQTKHRLARDHAINQMKAALKDAHDYYESFIDAIDDMIVNDVRNALTANQGSSFPRHATSSLQQLVNMMTRVLEDTTHQGQENAMRAGLQRWDAGIQIFMDKSLVLKLREILVTKWQQITAEKFTTLPMVKDNSGFVAYLPKRQFAPMTWRSADVEDDG